MRLTRYPAQLQDAALVQHSMAFVKVLIGRYGVSCPRFTSEALLGVPGGRRIRFALWAAETGDPALQQWLQGDETRAYGAGRDLGQRPTRDSHSIVGQILRRTDEDDKIGPQYRYNATEEAQAKEARKSKLTPNSQVKAPYHWDG